MYRYSETTRRQLYDRIAEERFPIPSPEQMENARIKDEYLETRSAEQAGLRAPVLPTAHAERRRGGRVKVATFNVRASMDQLARWGSQKE